MNQGFSMGKYVYSFLLILMLMSCVLVIQNNSAHASETNQEIERQVNLRATVTTDKAEANVNDEPVTNLSQNEPQLSTQNNVEAPNSPVIPKQQTELKQPQVVSTEAVQTPPIVPNKPLQKTSNVITKQNTKVSPPVKSIKKAAPVKTQPVKPIKAVPSNVKQPKAKTTFTSPKGIKPQHLSSSVKKTKPAVKKVAKKAPVTKKSKVVKAKSKAKIKTKTVSKKKAPVVSKKKASAVPKKKVQLLSTTVKKAPVKKKTVVVITKPKAAPKPVPKVAPKPKAPVSNYYNQAPKLWPKGIPGSENVRDFGQTTYASGINDALKIMKASGNKGVTINHTTAKAANIATIFNYNPTTKKLTYGTGTAIGKHTILTANHVANDSQARKPMTPSKVQNLRIDLLREGSKVARTVTVTGVKMLQYGDVALLYTKEDLSQYMTVRKIAPEASITKIKANTPIHMYHYGLPAGKFKNDPMGTMYHSTGKYSMMARNVNPIGYYQMMAEPGSSGGAVLNSKNEVLGVHAFRIASGEYQKYNLNTMAELRGKLRQEVIKNIK
ncbi:serine protease [Staphylococcus simulans]|uniref:trypsin-like serine protease n=1 Tax=Staphylococcus simulans TaxID=1286 RepID=UPI000D032FEE|nr:trypsin-like serine protease [Staphylococcus simulans]MCE5024334.1 trypsin-like peptidase domain-containing protein [Staphylococcus simulans]MEB6837439.1 trypsin-like peptidase domain-containing protein [Staphylococcus simulans]PTJ00642.1 serine protease [Staphylococcus simulans]PTJ08197.1 serine protease [Staphylococcus simulans]PTJ10152.1 serine protease [Staphylococcus simulans]